MDRSGGLQPSGRAPYRPAFKRRLRNDGNRPNAACGRIGPPAGQLAFMFVLRASASDAKSQDRTRVGQFRNDLDGRQTFRRGSGGLSAHDRAEERKRGGIAIMSRPLYRRKLLGIALVAGSMACSTARANLVGNLTTDSRPSLPRVTLDTRVSVAAQSIRPTGPILVLADEAKAKELRELDRIARADMRALLRSDSASQPMHRGARVKSPRRVSTSDIQVADSASESIRRSWLSLVLCLIAPPQHPTHPTPPPPPTTEPPPIPPNIVTAPEPASVILAVTGAGILGLANGLRRKWFSFRKKRAGG